ncbi:MAG: alpha/beta fold hydrolase [Chloroflexi bacterium]|nr:alpha/beta fold hydrolase [Chloroflexota bacterium]
MIARPSVFLLALIGAAFAVAWAISQHSLHPKWKREDHDLADFGLPAEDVTFASRDGTRLAGWFIPAAPAERGPAVVLSHGHGRSRAELLPHANFLHRAGYAVLAFDYRHRGESAGDAVTMGLREQDDLLGAIDALAARPEVDAGRIGVVAVSMGSVIAILVAADDTRVRALVAECPYATRDAVMTRALRHYFHLPRFPFAPIAHWLIGRRLGQPVDVADAIDHIARISPRPLFLIADEEDAVLGPEDTARLFAAAQEPKRYWLIPGAGHSRGWQAAPEEYERRALGFLNEALGVEASVADASAGDETLLSGV